MSGARAVFFFVRSSPILLWRTSNKLIYYQVDLIKCQMTVVQFEALDIDMPSPSNL